MNRPDGQCKGISIRRNLFQLIARFTRPTEQLETGEVSSLAEFAEEQGLDPSDTNKCAPLGYLAPSIVEDILEGRQPEHLSSRSLQRMADLPLDWGAQCHLSITTLNERVTKKASRDGLVKWREKGGCGEIGGR